MTDKVYIVQEEGTYDAKVRAVFLTYKEAKDLCDRLNKSRYIDCYFKVLRCTIGKERK